MRLQFLVIDLEIPPRVKRWGVRIGVPAVVLSVAAVALAQPVTFTAGQTLQASDLNNNFGYLVPSGAVTFFNLGACPTGWSVVAAAQGRYLVGLNTGGALAATVGAPLVDQENRAVGQHTHAITDPGHNHGGQTATQGASNGFAGSDQHSFGYTGTGASCGNGVSQFTTAGCYDDWVSHVHNIAMGATGITVENTGGVAGTNAPYVQYLVCQKN